MLCASGKGVQNPCGYTWQCAIHALSPSGCGCDDRELKRPPARVINIAMNGDRGIPIRITMRLNIEMVLPPLGPLTMTFHAGVAQNTEGSPSTTCNGFTPPASRYVC